MEPQIRYAKTSDDVSIAYLTVGAGPPLVITPHYGWSHIDMQWKYEPWRRVLEPLARFSTVVMYDHRGTGMSERRALDFSLDAWVRDLDAVVTSLEPVWPVALLGTSHGGPEAIRYASLHAERVSHLILYGTYANGRDMASAPFFAGMLALARNIGERDFLLWARTLASVGGIDPGWYSEYLRAGYSPEGMRLGLDALPQHDVSADLVAVRCPTLVIHSEWPDRSPEEHALTEALVTGIANARLEVVKRELGDGVLAMPDLSPLLRPFLGAGAADTAVAAHDSGVRTVLFTDLVGHTEMMRRLGDDRGRDVLREHEHITRDLLRQYAGAEVKTMGDGFMASFGSVAKAMDCAIALQRAFAAHTESMPEPLNVRVGLNAGEPIEEDGDLFGSTVIMASRIAAQAGAGEILIPEPLRHLLSGKSYVYADRGEKILKGFEDAVRLYEVRWHD
jgi:class 3 adenylate cyclase/pimeloyl-ACP methyl ester carboxylesterase